MSERLRWKIVDLVDRLLPGQCWTDLVCWVLARDEDRAENRLPWQPIGYTCRKDFAEAGSCYCGAMRKGGPERLCAHVRTTCCHAPVVHGEEWLDNEVRWVFPLRCAACGRSAGCLGDERDLEESWAGRSREDATAAGTPNQGGLDG